MSKIQYWLIGIGVIGLLYGYVVDFRYGPISIGLPLTALGLGIRQWFMADAHGERIGSAISNKGVSATYDKYHYHDL